MALRRRHHSHGRQPRQLTLGDELVLGMILVVLLLVVIYLGVHA